MNKTTRAISAALLMGASVVASGLVAGTPAYAAAAPAFKLDNKDKALYDAVTGAQADARAGRYPEAIAKAKQADGLPNKPAGLSPALHQMILGWAVQAKDYNGALDQVEKMIAANEGNKTENLKQALAISFMTKNQAKQKQYADQLGGNLDNETRLAIASQMANAGQFKEALTYAQPALEGNVSEAALKFQQATYFRMNDANGRRAALEQLVSNYPKPEYWHDLLQLARNQKGLNDEQAMDIYRLRLAVGDLKTVDDYFEAVQEALVAGYPAEAKAMLDKAAAAKLLNGERAGRLVKTTDQQVAANASVQADLQKKAATDPNAGVKLGLSYWSNGKSKEAEDAIRSGMNGKLADPDGAKIALGHALLGQGKKQDAINAFDSVAKNSKDAPIARLWAIYARRAESAKG